MEDIPISDLEKISNELRKRVFKTTKKAKSGHTGGCSSSVELMTALYFGGILKYNPENPKDKNRDRVLVRGHLGPLRYNIFSMLEWIDEKELDNYRQLNSRLEGHEDMAKVPGVDITPSGSLGMVLSYGAGAAVSAIKNNQDFLTYVFLGDGEEQEGNVSEAARHIASLGLNNIIAIIDKNKKQLSRPTQDSDGASDINTIWKGYGWDVKEIQDAHNLEKILEAYNWANKKGKKPKLIIANTEKGKGIPGNLEHYSGYHTVNTAKQEDLDSAILNYEEVTKAVDIPSILSKLRKSVPLPKSVKSLDNLEILNSPLDLKMNKKEYAHLLEGLVDYFQQLNKDFSTRPENLYVLTADIIRKELTPVLGLDTPSTTFIDTGIREQHLTAMAHGISNTDEKSKVLIDVGEEFLYRNADQLNVLSQAKSPVLVLGNMGGICGSKNGPTHQPSGQSGMLTLMPGMKCLEPSDVTDLFNSLNFAFSNTSSPTYIRMHSAPMAKIEDNISRNLSYYTIKDSENPEITLIGNGLTLKGCSEAYDILNKQGIASRVINIIDRKSLDENFVGLLQHNKPVLTVYNGNADSLSYPVSYAIMNSNSRYKPSRVVAHGFDYGKSGSLEDLIKYFGFDGQGIANLAKSILK
jgi:transketolase